MMVASHMPWGTAPSCPEAEKLVQWLKQGRLSTFDGLRWDVVLYLIIREGTDGLSSVVGT